MFPFFWTKIEYIIGVIVDKASQFLAIPCAFYQLEFIYAWQILEKNYYYTC